MLSIFVKHWKAVYFKPRRAIWASVFLILFFLSINSNILFTFGYEEYAINSTKPLLFCFEVDIYPSTKWMTTYGRIHLMLYSVMPFIILAILDVILIYKLYRRDNSLRQGNDNRFISRNRRNSRLEAMSKVVILITVSFIVLTLPIACASSFFAKLALTDQGLFIIVLLDCLSFSYHAFNIVISYRFNGIFKQEIKRTLVRRERHKSEAITINIHRV